MIISIVTTMVMDAPTYFLTLHTVGQSQPSSSKLLEPNRKFGNGLSFAAIVL